MDTNESANNPTNLTEGQCSKLDHQAPAPSAGFRRTVKRLVSRLAAAIALSVLTAAAAHAVALQSPYGLAADPTTGVVYIADPVAGGVLVYDPATGAVSSFANLPNAFSLAVDSNGNVYVGVVGASTRIEVYSSSGQLLKTLAVPPGDSPLTLAIDGGNVLYQANWANQEDTVGINFYNNDLFVPYAAFAAGGAPLAASTRVTTPTKNLNHDKFALAAEGGQIFVVKGDNPSQNIYDSTALISGQFKSFLTTIAFFEKVAIDATRAKIVPLISVTEGVLSWRPAHQFPVLGTAVAASFDAFHNLFYSDNDQGAITTTSKAGPASQLLTGLPSAPYGIVYNKVRKRLYVAFPEEHLIRSYKVTYSTQEPKIPTALDLSKTIQ